MAGNQASPNQMLLLPSSWSLFVFLALACVLMSLNTLPSSMIICNSSQNKGLPWFSGHFLTSPLSAQYPMLLPTVPKPQTETGLPAMPLSPEGCPPACPTHVASQATFPGPVPGLLPWDAQGALTLPGPERYVPALLGMSCSVTSRHCDPAAKGLQMDVLRLLSPFLCPSGHPWPLHAPISLFCSPPQTCSGFHCVPVLTQRPALDGAGQVAGPECEVEGTSPLV